MKLKHGNFTWKFMSDEERMDWSCSLFSYRESADGLLQIGMRYAVILEYVGLAESKLHHINNPLKVCVYSLCWRYENILELSTRITPVLL
jgi:hypothetical protein